MNAHPLLKLFIAPLSLSVTLGIFAGLGWIIQGPSDASLQSKPPRLNMNWVKLQDSPNLETLKPPPPPPPPPPPEMQPPSSLSANKPSNLAQSLDATAVNLHAAPNLDGVFDIQPPTLNLGLDASADLPVHREAPFYPPRALNRGIEGWVELEFEVDARGQVIPSTIAVISAQPQGIFERSAKEAIAKWRFAAFELAPGKNRKLKQRLEFKRGNN